MVDLGEGSISRGTEANAASNMTQFVEDCTARGLQFERVHDKDLGDGRYSFRIYQGTRSQLVRMPGLPLEQVRCVGSVDPSGYPRLYLDGNSYWWRYAVMLVMFPGEGSDDTS